MIWQVKGPPPKNTLKKKNLLDFIYKYLRPTLHYESRPMFNSIQAFLLVLKFEISPPRTFFTLGVKPEIEKKSFQSAHMLLKIKAELYSLVYWSQS